MVSVQGGAKYTQCLFDERFHHGHRSLSPVCPRVYISAHASAPCPALCRNPWQKHRHSEGETHRSLPLNYQPIHLVELADDSLSLYFVFAESAPCPQTSRDFPTAKARHINQPHHGTIHTFSILNSFSPFWINSVICSLSWILLFSLNASRVRLLPYSRKL